MASHTNRNPALGAILEAAPREITRKTPGLIQWQAVSDSQSGPERRGPELVELVFLCLLHGYSASDLASCFLYQIFAH